MVYVMAQGKLQIEVTTANSALPVGGTVVRVLSKNGEVISEQTVNADGSGTEVLLDAPDPGDSLEPTGEEAYSEYDVTAEKPGYYPVRIQNVQIFGDTSSTLPIGLIPLPEDMDSFDIVYPIGENALLQNYTPMPDSSPEGRIFRGEPFIPEYITVHLGSPSSNASNVTVPFIDYIKNVASSEIYPTWPEAALRANILAQISLALNRIYTEWYPSQGRNFDITNSTAYDQYYVYGRNVFDNISDIVDEIFNTYIRKPGRLEPYYAEYCNGTTVTCSGMSQWGTVSLANQGYSPMQILRFYYGDLDLVTSTDIRGAERSYPGSPLTVGSSGESVRFLQEQLNRIAINYPSIPLQSPDGIFGSRTAEAVRAFQRIFNLTPDGVVGKNTWYRISYIYTAIKRLAELSSEGQRVSYSSQTYPGSPLRNGSVGSEVQEIQFYLSRIAAFNSSIPRISIDGRYGRSTATAVRAFQSYYGLTADGIVGRATWDKLVEVYNGSLDNVEENGAIEIVPYPGNILSTGSSGAYVRYIQAILNGIRNTFPLIPSVIVDGQYGPSTSAQVQAFQRLFGLTPDGIVGRNTWNRANEIYSAVSSGCINSSGGSLPAYPGSLLAVGSSGSNVRTVQRYLNSVRTVLPVIPYITVDGQYGEATRSAVRTFQSIFGLTPDGIVGRSTWNALSSVYGAVQNGCLSGTSSFSVLPDDRQNRSISPDARPDGDYSPTSAEPSEESVKIEEEPTFEASAYPLRIEPVCQYCSPDSDMKIYKNNRPHGRHLRVGCFGRDVLDMKHHLCEKLGVPIKAVGDNMLFGLNTKLAVEDFQCRNGLTPTGTVDCDTLDLIYR